MYICSAWNSEGLTRVVSEGPGAGGPSSAIPPVGGRRSALNGRLPACKGSVLMGLSSEGSFLAFTFSTGSALILGCGIRGGGRYKTSSTSEEKRRAETKRQDITKSLSSLSNSASPCKTASAWKNTATVTNVCIKSACKNKVTYPCLCRLIAGADGLDPVQLFDRNRLLTGDVERSVVIGTIVALSGRHMQ